MAVGMKDHWGAHRQMLDGHSYLVMVIAVSPDSLSHVNRFGGSRHILFGGLCAARCRLRARPPLTIKDSRSLRITFNAYYPRFGL